MSTTAGTSSSLSKIELQHKLDLQVARLAEIPSVPENQRIRKRIFQTIGKYKRELQDTITSDENDIFLPSSKRQKISNQLTKKQLKAKMHSINQELKECAQKKQLHQAQRIFQGLIRKSLPPTIHTFTNLINVCVRCEDISQAKSMYAMMLQSKITPNVVTLTTLLKGYCEAGDFSSAEELLYQSFPTYKIIPGIRT